MLGARACYRNGVIPSRPPARPILHLRESINGYDLTPSRSTEPPGVSELAQQTQQTAVEKSAQSLFELHTAIKRSLRLPASDLNTETWRREMTEARTRATEDAQPVRKAGYLVDNVKGLLTAPDGLYKLTDREAALVWNGLE